MATGLGDGRIFPVKSSRSPVVQAPSGIALAFLAKSFPSEERTSSPDRRAPMVRDRRDKRPRFSYVWVFVDSPNPPKSTSSSATFHPSNRRDVRGCRFALAGASTQKTRAPVLVMTSANLRASSPEGSSVKEARRQSVARASCSWLRWIVGGQVRDSRRGPPFKGTREPKTPWPSAAKSLATPAPGASPPAARDGHRRGDSG